MWIPYISHFLPDFSGKMLKNAYFEHFLGKFLKKSAIFCTFYFEIKAIRASARPAGRSSARPKEFYNKIAR